MSDPRLSGGGDGGVRQWRFADCLFDESNWTLSVAGRRVAIESKPLEILRQLLLHAGRVVSKAELLDAIWPGIAVVEASLPTAVRKLRLALGDEQRDVHIVETVSRIGYRLAVPVERVEPATADEAAGSSISPLSAQPFAAASLSARPIAAVLLAGGLVGAAMLASGNHVPPSPDLAHPSAKEVVRTIHALDVERIQSFIDAGWDVDMPLSAQRDFAFGALAEICEWNPGADRGRMVLLGRALIDGGHDFTHRNAFGDTSYSIAKAKRYCGPNHPLTVMLRNMCYRGPNAERLGDRCLASYELARRAGSGGRDKLLADGG